MAYLGNAPARSFISFERQVFTIVNSQTAYTLSHSVTNENDIRLVINNVVQEPGSGKAYTASGTTLTLSAALTNGTDEMYCVFLGRAVGTVNPPAASVGSAQVADSLISGKTALGATPADTDELLISDAGTLKRVDYSYLKGGDNTPAFSAYINSDQTLTDNTDTKGNYDTEAYDTDSAYDTSNKRFTVPSGEGGKYFFYARGRFYNNSDHTSQLVIAIRKNNSEVAKRYAFSGGTGTKIFHSMYYYSYDISCTLVLSASDYVEVFVKADDVSGNTVTFNGGTVHSEFTGYKLIGV